MEFARPRPRRRLAEPALPMINVVFLLLIFFLMSARIAPPPPFEIAPPEAESGEEGTGAPALHISAEGDLAYGAARGAAVWTALGARGGEEAGEVLIRADAALPAAEVARVLARLRQIGITDIRLATVQR